MSPHTVNLLHCGGEGGERGKGRGGEGGGEGGEGGGEGGEESGGEESGGEGRGGEGRGGGGKGRGEGRGGGKGRGGEGRGEGRRGGREGEERGEGRGGEESGGRWWWHGRKGGGGKGWSPCHYYNALTSGMVMSTKLGSNSSNFRASKTIWKRNILAKPHLLPKATPIITQGFIQDFFVGGGKFGARLRAIFFA